MHGRMRPGPARETEPQHLPNRIRKISVTGCDCCFPSKLAPFFSVGERDCRVFPPVLLIAFGSARSGRDIFGRREGDSKSSSMKSLQTFPEGRGGTGLETAGSGMRVLERAARTEGTGAETSDLGSEFSARALAAQSPNSNKSIRRTRGRGLNSAPAYAEVPFITPSSIPLNRSELATVRTERFPPPPPLMFSQRKFDSSLGRFKQKLK